jgi:DNA-binding CsgD family transcriptional regulator/PAS domain-containing protein
MLLVIQLTAFLNSLTSMSIQELMQEYQQLLSSQQFDENELDYNVLDKHLQMLEMLGITQTSLVSIFDMFQQKHIYLSSNFSSILGYNLDEVHQSGNEYFDKKVHPEDFFQSTETGIYFLKMAFAIPHQERVHYKLFFDYRIQNSGGEYVRVIEQFKLLEADKRGNIWLALCLLDLSPDQNLDIPFRSRLMNMKTGEIYNFEPLKSQINTLSNREKEVLSLLSQGLISKQIADHLYISQHTVNTHRQRIIEKLNVSNTIEAIRYAMRVGILG